MKHAEALHLAKWAAQECEWQMSGEKSVARLIEAVLECRGWNPPITHREVLRLGHLIEPSLNYGTYRGVNVIVGLHKPPDWMHVNRLMHQLLEEQDNLTPTEFFMEFELVHPFRDGNGRTGAILYNWLQGNLEPNGRLTMLEFPPDLFGDGRRAGVTMENV